MRANSLLQSHSLNVEFLTKTYGASVAVDNISLTIEAGSFFSLLGPSGSGKTTVLMMLAGFTEPTSGSILFDGQIINNVPPERRNFGMVFQGYALFPHRTVAQNVSFPLEVRGIGRSERHRLVKSALDLVRLGGLQDRYPKQLSGGQQQRVALARAIVFEPSILLLDEPLSALDKKLRMSLQWELRELHRRLGMTFVCVTHDQEEALSMSDEIAIIRDGRIVQKGTPADLFERPDSHFIADFLGDSNFVDGRVVKTYPDGFDYEVGGLHFRQGGTGGALGEGTAILIALRPSKVLAQEPLPESGCNAVEGKIRHWSYRGTEIYLQVETGIGSLHVLQPTWRAPFSPETGKRVWLSWAPDATVVVSDDRRATGRG